MRSGGLRIQRKTDVRLTFLQFRYKVRTELLRVENRRTIWTGVVVSIVTATITLLLSKLRPGQSPRCRRRPSPRTPARGGRPARADRACPWRTASRCPAPCGFRRTPRRLDPDRKSTRLNSSHVKTSYAVFCLNKK